MSNEQGKALVYVLNSISIDDVNVLSLNALCTTGMLLFTCCCFLVVVYLL